MRTIAIVVGSIMIAAAGVALAQGNYSRERNNETYRAVADPERECWNSGAGHFERVRPGERQGDLDFSRCRYIGEVARDEGWSSGRQECWNPGARHFEGVRPGERQDDLDFSRCRNIRDSVASSIRQECWNQRAGHFEDVRPGERQDDLDFSRCREYRERGAR